jgi:hypothetical protein
MNRERALRVLLVLVGLTCLAGLYPLVTSLLHVLNSEVGEGDQMILSIYISLGVFLLLAARNPAKHRSLIAFAAWGTIAHDVVMVLQALERGSLREQFPAFTFIAVVCVALIRLNTPARIAESVDASRDPVWATQR